MQVVPFAHCSAIGLYESYFPLTFYNCLRCTPESVACSSRIVRAFVAFILVLHAARSAFSSLDSYCSFGFVANSFLTVLHSFRYPSMMFDLDVSTTRSRKPNCGHELVGSPALRVVSCTCVAVSAPYIAIPRHEFIIKASSSFSAAVFVE